MSTNTVEERGLDDWLETCELAARAGGQKILALRGHFQTRAKAPADLVTDADVASQEAIRHVIAGRYPDHAFVGEESSTGAGGRTTASWLGLLIHWTERPIMSTATRTTQFLWRLHKEARYWWEQFMTRWLTCALSRASAEVPGATASG